MKIPIAHHTERYRQSGKVGTEKDAVRFPRLETSPVKCLYLRIAIEMLSGADSFGQIINRICFRGQTPPRGAGNA